MQSGLMGEKHFCLTAQPISFGLIEGAQFKARECSNTHDNTVQYQARCCTELVGWCPGLAAGAQWEIGDSGWHLRFEVRAS